MSEDTGGEFGQIFEGCDPLRTSCEAVSARGLQSVQLFDVPPRSSRADDRREG